ncbi:MAG: alpha-galactosidase, partial [Steroidobacteraceae bacterium]
RAAVPAATPPLGWNSYDAYGTTVTEAQFRALPPGRYAIRDLWQHRDQGIAAALTVPLEGHGTALYRLQPR